jgi:hypothetical protein
MDASGVRQNTNETNTFLSNAGSIITAYLNDPTHGPDLMPARDIWRHDDIASVVIALRMVLYLERAPCLPSAGSAEVC